MSIKNNLIHIIKTCFSIDIDNEQIIINISDDNRYYFTDVALVLSKLLNKDSIDIAKLIVDNIECDIIDNLEVDSSGIINIFLSKKYLIDEANNIVNSGKNYGKSDCGKGRTVNIEYSSIVNADGIDMDYVRMAIYGDCLSNIMSFSGYDVTREFYVKNADNNQNIDDIKKQLDSIRINFDVFTEEKFMYDKGLIDITLNKLQKSNKCYIEEDSLWVETADLYDDKNRVLIDGNGTYSYFLSQIAYHVYKFARGYDKIIDLLRTSDCESINGLKSAIEFAGYSSDKVKFINFSGISTTNNVNINLNNLINEINVNTLRYHLVGMNDNVIDVDLMKKNSDENPIYYIESAYIKLCSILKRYSRGTMNKYSTIDSESAYIILNRLIEFEDIVIRANSGNINIICDYLYDLASLFNCYYNELENVAEHCEEDFIILSALRVVMNNTSNILGLILREEL